MTHFAKKKRKQRNKTWNLEKSRCSVASSSPMISRAGIVLGVTTQISQGSSNYNRRIISLHHCCCLCHDHRIPLCWTQGQLLGLGPSPFPVFPLLIRSPYWASTHRNYAYVIDQVYIHLVQVEYSLSWCLILKHISYHAANIYPDIMYDSTIYT